MSEVGPWYQWSLLQIHPKQSLLRKISLRFKNCGFRVELHRFINRSAHKSAKRDLFKTPFLEKKWTITCEISILNKKNQSTHFFSKTATSITDVGLFKKNTFLKEKRFFFDDRHRCEESKLPQNIHSVNFWGSENFITGPNCAFSELYADSATTTLHLFFFCSFIFLIVLTNF